MNEMPVSKYFITDRKIKIHGKKKIQLKQNQILRANAFMAWYVVEHKMFHLLFVPLIPSVYYESWPFTKTSAIK